MEETKVITKDSGFHSVNIMQEIGWERSITFTMAAGADKDIVTKLTEAV